MDLKFDLSSNRRSLAITGMLEDDVATVSSVVDRAYAVLDFPPGGEPDWTVAEELYDPAVILALRVFPDDLEISVLTWDQYKSSQMRAELAEHGYSETPGSRRLSVVGDVAFVEQSFVMQFRHRPAASAMDYFSLARLKGRWQIVAVLSDLAPSGMGLPLSISPIEIEGT